MNLLSVAPLVVVTLLVGAISQQPRPSGSIEGTITRRGSNSPQK